MRPGTGQLWLGTWHTLLLLGWAILAVATSMICAVLNSYVVILYT